MILGDWYRWSDLWWIHVVLESNIIACLTMCHRWRDS